MTSPDPRRVLVVAIDVTDLTDDEVDALAVEVAVQAEASDDHPDAGHVVTEVVLGEAALTTVGGTLDQRLSEEPYRALVRMIGPGFHPDTRGADYTNLPPGLTAEDVDRIVDNALRDLGEDRLYEVAVETVEALG